MEGSTTALFYRPNTLIRLVTDQMLGYRLCHLSKSWESRKNFLLYLLLNQSTRLSQVSPTSPAARIPALIYKSFA